MCLISEDSFSGDKQSLALLLASHGWLDELKIVSEWDGFLTSKALSRAIAVAGGDMEMTAYLLDEKARHYGADDHGLSLGLDEDSESIPVLPSKRVGLFDVMEEDQITFKGSIFVLTGLDDNEEFDVREFIGERGGIVRESVVLDTNYLIVNEKYWLVTDKYRRAIRFIEEMYTDIRIVALSDFYDLIQ